jgi:hypothetical protein
MAITSQPQRAGFPLTLALPPDCLSRASWVRISRVRTISVERIGKRAAEFDPKISLASRQDLALEPGPADNMSVEKTVRIFTSFEDSGEADARYDASLSPQERLRILIELRNHRHPDAVEQRLARVSRVVELERS